MSDTVISVENVSKVYRLGEIGTGTLSHDLNRWWHNFRGKEDPYIKICETNDRAVKGNSDYVWALKDVSFEVKRGEVLGIIGRNGAGKSTLLKILSRVTTPTTGEIKIKGRIASLLEVGTGFNPELTGRDNIYLNGSILGMRRREIDSKFDEIVDFAEVERYIDTPVKRYSSGMYVRLAFAVAAHLEPEILIVDEVLAVGDVLFQRKCLGKLHEISSGQNRTVLFVSHNREAVTQLCSRVHVLRNGQLAFTGSPAVGFANLMADYTQQILDETTGVGDRTVRRGDGRARYSRVQVQHLRNSPENQNLEEYQEIVFDMECKVINDIPRLESYVAVRTPLGTEALIAVKAVVSESKACKGGTFTINFRIKSRELAPGAYPLYIWLGAGENSPCDVLDGLVPPLNVTAAASNGTLNGADGASSRGCFDVHCLTSCRRV